jgi:TetR/AcrR family fatty acid metabolism transcriptional regulator
MKLHSERRAMKEDKRDAIREAGIRVFSAKGFHEARADEIAQAAGVAVGTIYNYFKSKEDILLDIFAIEFAERRRFYEELRRGGLPVVEQLRRILAQHFARLSQKQELMQVLLRERFEAKAGFREQLTQLYREMTGYVEELIRQGVAEGWVRRCNPQIVAHAIFGIFESVIGCGMVYGPKEAEGIFCEAPKELAEFIWKGIGIEKGE